MVEIDRMFQSCRVLGSYSSSSPFLESSQHTALLASIAHAACARCRMEREKGLGPPGGSAAAIRVFERELQGLPKVTPPVLPHVTEGRSYLERLDAGTGEHAVDRVRRGGLHDGVRGADRIVKRHVE